MMVMSVAELRLRSNKGCEAKWWCKRKSRQPAQSVELPLGQINAAPPPFFSATSFSRVPAFVVVLVPSILKTAASFIVQLSST